MTSMLPEHAPKNPAGPAPVRRAQSIRRTMSIDTDWPEGIGGTMHMVGRARDLLTLSDISQSELLAEDQDEIWASAKREILAIKTSRGSDIAQGLVGLRAGGHLRKSILELFPHERQKGTLLHLLLDDFPGASLVAGWAWTQWTDDAYEQRKRVGGITSGRGGQMEGVCSGFRPGSSGLKVDGSVDHAAQSSTVVPSLINTADPDGWHKMPDQMSVGMRRARRMDVWFQGQQIRVDIGFQDSASSPAGPRVAVHEYTASAAVDMDSLELLWVHATPQILPFRECPGAVGNIDRLIGLPLPRFRAEVTLELSGILGCTHLNDVLRSLSDVQNLALVLKGMLDKEKQPKFKL